MKNSVLFLIFCLAITNGIKADISEKYYFLIGNINNILNQEIENKIELYIVQGSFSKIIKTDKEGQFIVKVKYLKPCLSGGNKEYTDLNMLKLAKSYNGEKLEIYIPSKSIKIDLKETWMNYYFEHKMDDESTNIDIDNSKSIKTDSTDQKLLNYFQTLDNCNQKSKDISTRTINNEFKYNYQLEDIKFLINHIEFHNHKFDYFLNASGLKKHDFVEVNKERLFKYNISVIKEPKKFLEIQLGTNNTIESINFKYGS